MVAKNRTNNKKVNESTLFDDHLKMAALNSKLIREDDEPQDGPDRSGENKPETDEAPGAMDEQTLRVECLKIAVKIAKLFDEVQPSDLIEMSDQVFKYVQHQDMTSGEWDSTYGLGDEESNEEPAEETPDEDVEDFDVEDLGDLETPEENNEVEDKEEKQDETASEIPDDFFDFDVS